MGKGALPRILPFAIFMAVIGIEQGCSFLLDKGILTFDRATLLYFYPLRVALTGAALLYFRRQYVEIRFRDLKRPYQTAAVFLTGILVFVLWINMDWTLFGDGSRGFDPRILESANLALVMTGVRLCGAVVVVPVMEELFWRSFLTRYLVKQEFLQVTPGLFTSMSFFTSAVLFGLEHHLVFAGIMAGLVYNLVLYTTRSVSQCILAHTVTNLALGMYVLATGSWRFW